jgi:Protein involved in formate dehydrogenase formation
MSAERRFRAEALRERHPFAAELLTLYLALLPVQEEASESPPQPDELPRWAAERVLPRVVETTVAAGPAVLAESARGRLANGDGERALAGWLQGAELEPVDRYLARASLGPVLEALGERAGDACAPAPNGDGGEHCPRCGGVPQLSCIASSGDKLVSGRRNLLCSRCGWTWTFSRSLCPACGESEEDKLVVYAERLNGAVTVNGKHDGAEPVFPHLRIAGCSTCSRYLIEVDMAGDPRAVPEVDELAALPLDLHAADQGLRKVTPNLMGF